MNSYYPLVAALSANIIAQILKPLFLRFRKKHWNLSLAFESGGFPSSHSSCVVALCIAVGLQDGLESTTFAISLILSLIVCYDAANIRYYAGRNIAITQQLIKDLEFLAQTKLEDPVYMTKIKDVLGHKWIEVIGGIIVGILTALMLSLLMRS